MNADDFGLHTAVNHAVRRAHRDGVLTSASVMACGGALDEAVEIAHEVPTLDIGVHLTLNEERPLTPARSLVDAEGRLPKNYREFARGWFSGRIRRDEVYREMTAQLARVLQSGLRPSHLDSHQHVHCLPGVWSATVEIARQHGIRFVRFPWFDSYSRNTRTPIENGLRGVVNVLTRWRRTVQHPALHRAAWTRGLDLSGRMTRDEMRRIIRTPRDGVNEIVVHVAESDPDFADRYGSGDWVGFNGPGDLAAVLEADAAGDLRGSGIQFTTFAALSR